MKIECLLRVQNSLQLVSFLSQIKPLHTYHFSICKIYFNTKLPSTFWAFPAMYTFWVFPPNSCTNFSPALCMLHAQPVIAPFNANTINISGGFTPYCNICFFRHISLCYRVTNHWGGHCSSNTLNMVAVYTFETLALTLNVMKLRYCKISNFRRGS